MPSFRCEHCGTALETDLSPGDVEECPECGHHQLVPESKAGRLAAWLAEKARDKEKRRKEKAERTSEESAWLPPSDQMSPPPLPPQSSQPTQLPVPYSSDNVPAQVLDHKICPFCAEEIHFEAIKCKHCNEFLDGRYRTPVVIQTAPPGPVRVKTSEDSFLTRNRNCGDIVLYGCLLPIIGIFILAILGRGC